MCDREGIGAPVQGQYIHGNTSSLREFVIFTGVRYLYEISLDLYEISLADSGMRSWRVLSPGTVGRLVT